MSCVPMSSERDISEDAILGGRLRIRQPLRGHRVGHDAVLLVAAADARAGEQAVEFGSGVGAVGLALAARVPGLTVTLIEIDASLCALAKDNARLNGLDDRVNVLSFDVEDLSAMKAAGFSESMADRVLMNPPFRDARHQNVSPDPGRRLAHVGPPGLLGRWLDAAAWLLKPRGVLTLIWPADGLAEVLGLLQPVFGEIGVLPVMSRKDAPAIRVLVRGVKGGGGTPVAYPALVLNDGDGRPTTAAEAVLREGKTLNLARGLSRPIA
jgi:tRNA1(Val) A37 N6-methylase TrmN6